MGVARRPLAYTAQVASQWYCEYLRLHGLYANNDCGECIDFTSDLMKPLSRCFDSGQLFQETLSSECETAVGGFSKPLCEEECTDSSTTPGGCNVGSHLFTKKSTDS